MSSSGPASLLSQNLVGFTILFQGAAVLSRGCGWFLENAYRKVGRHSDLVFLWGGISLLLSGSVLLVFGGHLPGAAGDLSLPAQLAGMMSVIIVSIYIEGLQRTNVVLHRNIEKTHQLTLTQRLRHHFLFNALNTTVCLITVRPDIASDNLTDLSQLFRTMLKQKPMVTLMEEVGFAKRYIRIERARLGKRLDVKWDMPDKEVLGAKLPSMVIQPLVENAIYHGIETLPEGGVIRIAIKSCRNRIVFDIRNPIQDSHPHVPRRLHGNGVAQQSISERLSRAYGAAFRLNCKHGCGEYRVVFSIPRRLLS